MKRCNSVCVHWHIALLEFLCTPCPDGHSPSELLGRQFCGILPLIDTNTVNSDKFAVRKDKEKEKFDEKHPRELKPLLFRFYRVLSQLRFKNLGVLVLSFHVHLITGVIISKLRMIRSFLIIGNIFVKLMLNLFCRSSMFQKF